MQVSEVNGDDVTCLIKNSATLSGSLYTLHVSQIRIDLPTLTDKDKEVTTGTCVKVMRLTYCGQVSFLLENEYFNFYLY